MNDQSIEQEIQTKGLTAPRVTLADIEANIASEFYFTAADAIAGIVDDAMVSRFLTWPVPASAHPDGAPGKPGRTGTNLLTAIEAREMLNHVTNAPIAQGPLGRLTFCVLVLRNGFTVTGESACASPENFDAELCRKIARHNAVNKIWPLVGYELRSKLATVEQCTNGSGECVQDVRQCEGGCLAQAVSSDAKAPETPAEVLQAAADACGVSKGEVLTMIAEFTRNGERLSSCQSHNFDKIPPEAPKGLETKTGPMSYQCKNCGGQVSTYDYLWHERGRRSVSTTAGEASHGG